MSKPPLIFCKILVFDCYADIIIDIDNIGKRERGFGMPDQSKLAEILYRMQSDTIMEHTAAADDFLKEGFPTTALLSIIEKVQQVNLVSMYFYICGKRSDQEALNAWHYLYRRFEARPEQFISNTFSPWDLSDENRYLLFSARKYLITTDKINVFFTYLESIKQDAEKYIKAVLEKLDESLDSRDNQDSSFNSRYIEHIRHIIDREVSSSIIKSGGNLTNQELNAACQVTTLDIYAYCCSIQNVKVIPLLLYRQWLLFFFLETGPRKQIKSTDILGQIYNRDFLIRYIGYNSNFIDSILSKGFPSSNRRSKASNSPPKKKIRTDIINETFQNMRDMVVNFSFDEYISEAEKKSEFPNLLRYYENRDLYNSTPHKHPAEMRYGRPFFPDVPCPYYDSVEELSKIYQLKQFMYIGFGVSSFAEVLYTRTDIDFCLNLLNQAESVLLLSIGSDKKKYVMEALSSNMYFFFEQEIYDTDYSLGFGNNILYLFEKISDTSLYENLLLPYLKEDAFFDFGSKQEARAYMALDALLIVKSIKAYSFIKRLLTSSKSTQLVPPLKNYWDFGLRQFYKALWKGNYVEREAWDIGMDWEYLCQKIACTYYSDVLTNHDGICLENRTIPDIMVGTVRRNEFGRVVHAERIIDCKKSLYFTGFFGNIFNNETTSKYYDYCDTLEYWILEKDELHIDSSKFQKLKCVFADEFLEAPWLSDDFKDAIRILLEEISRRNSNPSHEIETTDELFHAIDYLIKFPPPDIRFLSIKPTIKTKQVKPKTVIRQYTMDGIFLKEFASPSLAAEEFGIRVDAITNATSGRRNSAGGFLWKKCSIDSPIENIEPPNTAFDLEGKVIFQVDQNGEIISTYETIGQAAKLSGIDRRSISDALKGIQKTAGGFTWALGDKTLISSDSQ